MGNCVILRWGITLVTLELDGSDHRRITQLPIGLYMSPDWAPAGDRVVFYGFTSSGLELRKFIVETASGTVRRLIGNSSLFDLEHWPQYAPDGQWIYFVGRPPGEGDGIWRVTADGSDAQRVGPAHPTGWSAATVSVSPDGERVGYAAKPDFTEDWQIYLLEVASGSVDTLNILGHSPRWSPTGDRIAFVQSGQVKLMTPDGLNVQTLSAPGTSYELGLAWSPDGQWVSGAVEPSFSFRTTLHLIQVSTGLTLPLPFSASHSEASWAP